MRDWSIPGSVEELFSNGPTQYHIIDPDYSGDNVYAMRLFIESVEGLAAHVVEDEGTQIVVAKDGVSLVIDSGGLGDFDRHGFDVNLLEEEHG